jgi:Family of unknown function (DUF6445)
LATAAFDLEVGAIAADVFAVNPDPVIDVRTVGHGQHRVVVVDGFYRHPERVLALVDELQFREDVRSEVALPLLRAVARAELGHLVPMIRAYARQKNLVSSDAMWFVVQGMWGNTPLKDRQRLPHNDPTAAALVYLNRPEDCAGGTGLYRHRPTGLEVVPLRADARMVELARDLGYPACRLNRRTASYVEMVARVVYDTRQANRDGSMLNGGNEYWDLMDLIEMRFNRLVVYDARIPHTVYLEPGSFEDVPRLVQMLGIEFDENVW